MPPDRVLLLFADPAFEKSRVVRGDHKAYFNMARERIHDLEETLLADVPDRAETKDMGWDTESLREDFQPRPEELPDSND